MADFTSTVNSSSITVTWDAVDVSGLSAFSIKLNDVERYSGRKSSVSPFTINGLVAATEYHLVVTALILDQNLATSIYLVYLY